MNNHYGIAKEEMFFYGSENTSLQNLLAVLIGPKANPVVTGQLAALGVKQITQLSKEELTSFEGIGSKTAEKIAAAVGLAKLINKYSIEEKTNITSPEDAAKCFEDLALLDQEHFVVAYLNTKNQVIHKKTVFIGSLNASIVHPREVFKSAIKYSAASVICAHNHPSGDPVPSIEDIEVTRRLCECGRMIGIDILDHVIIGHGGKFISLKEKGYIS